MAIVPHKGREECPVDRGCSRRQAPPGALPPVLQPQRRQSEAVGGGSIVLSPSSKHLAEIVLQWKAAWIATNFRQRDVGTFLLEELLSGCSVTQELTGADLTSASESQ